MSNMEILTTNYLDTTTLVAVASGTDTVGRLFNRNIINNYYSSDGYNTNTSGVTVGVTFPTAKSISRIVLQGINLKSFKIYYNSNAANTFTLVNAETSVSDWATNSDTALYLKVATISVDSIFIVCTETMAGGDEKHISHLGIHDKKFVFEDNPDVKGYKPQFESKEVSHEMSDGGTVKYTFGDAFDGRVKLDYQSETMYDNLYNLYKDRLSFVFVPFPTGTNWDGIRYWEVNWIGDFEFEQPAGNDWRSLGYSGQMRLKETPK